MTSNKPSPLETLKQLVPPCLLERARYPYAQYQLHTSTFWNIIKHFGHATTPTWKTTSMKTTTLKTTLMNVYQYEKNNLIDLI